MPPHAASALDALFEQTSIGDLRALRIEPPRAHAPRATLSEAPTAHRPPPAAHPPPPPPAARRPPPTAHHPRRSFGERYVDNRRFAILYAEALFTRFANEEP
jgi:hypothetical protein